LGIVALFAQYYLAIQSFVLPNEQSSVMNVTGILMGIVLNM
jgi:hypothetical protein